MPLLGFVGFLTLVFVITQVQKLSAKRKLRKRLSEAYGKKPEERKLKFYLIEQYWTMFSGSIPQDEKIDAVTWNDLDMDKVFGRINACCSYAGEQVLYSRMHELPKSDANRQEFDEKVEFIASSDEDRVSIQMILSALGKEYHAYDLPVFLSNLSINRIPRVWMYRVMHYALILSIILSIVIRQPMYYLALGCVFSINLFAYTVGKMKYEVNLDTLRDITAIVDAGKKISEAGYSFSGNLTEAIRPFKKMNRTLSLLNFKKEMAGTGDFVGLFYDYLIGATLWDFLKYDQVMNTLNARQEDFLTLYEEVGEMDAAISVASFRESLSTYCHPVFSSEHALNMKRVYHPLIDDPVCNSARLEKGTLITGSNASGKSTFIKAMALNVILAQNINTCMAEEAVMPRAQVITSMAVRDDLESGESYYIKEIKYLKRIIENLNEERLVICVIDEILRGTNTDERIAASTSILKYLSDKNCMAIVASHDIELTQKLGDLYVNYHFTEKMEENDVIFDYKIYEGVSTSRNAIRLLGTIGFPDEVISEAVQMRS